MKTKSLLIIGMLSLWLSSCSTADELTQPEVPVTPDVEIPNVDPTSKISLTSAEKDIARAMNVFGINFFKKVAENEELVKQFPNYAISPVSLSLGFGLLANIIDPASAEVLSDELGFKTLTEYNVLCRKLMTYLPDETNQNALEIANSIWYCPEISPSDDFIGIISENYFGTLSKLNFKETSSPSVINNWVAKATKGLIPTIVSDLDPRTRIFFANALYFKAEWNEQFLPDHTYSGKFCSPAGEYEVDMMVDTKKQSTYYHGRNFEAVTLPYAGNTEFVALLPAANTTVTDLLNSITNKDIEEIVKDSKNEKIRIHMPKFESTADVDCNEVFEKMGIHIPKNNLVGFNEDLDEEYLNLKIAHKSVVKTSETGTEAAAVTAGWDAALPDFEDPQPQIITLNRPFLYLIRNTVTGSIIMMGQVTKP